MIIRDSVTITWFATDGYMAQPVVQVGHMLAPDRGNGQLAELGQNVLAHHTMMQLRRARFAAHRDMLAIVPLREIGHRRPGFHARQGRGNRIFSRLDAGQDQRRPAPRLVGGG